MKTSWTAGLAGEAKNIAISDFKSSVGARQRLQKLIQDKIESNAKERLSKINYESPSWALIQADAIGYERAMQEVISIISDKTV